MTRVVSLSAGNFKVQDGARIVVETDAARKSFNLVPAAAIHLTGYALTYPDFNATNAYFWGFEHTSTDHYTEGCESFTSIPPQEWGPDKTLLLADDVVGSLPQGTEFLSVRMKMTHAVPPENFFGKPIRDVLTSGQWVDLGDEAATLVESFSTILQRMVSFHIDNTNPADPRCRLRRRQSTVKSNNGSLWASGNSTSAANGWTHSGTNSVDAVIAKLRQSKGPTNFFSVGDVPTHVYRRDGGSPCATSDNLNLASVWTGDIEITPGRVSAAS